MSGIGAVNMSAAAPASAPQQAAKPQGTQAPQALPGQGNQEDVLSISREGIQALEKGTVEMALLGNHRHHHHQEVTLDLLTYPNFLLVNQQTNATLAQQGGAAQAQGGTAAPAAVSGVGAGGGAGAAK
ncbi:MAG: hypothetical protein ABSH53_07070 [Holophaga sp.]|jgi:hypothetical protein